MRPFDAIAALREAERAVVRKLGALTETASERVECAS